MGKFYGDIGFSSTTEVSDGVWKETVVKKKYYGEVTKISKRFNNDNKVNEDIQIHHQLSIIADSFVFDNFNSIKFVNWMGSNWRVSTIELQRPRLILVLGGGLYNIEDE